MKLCDCFCWVVVSILNFDSIFYFMLGKSQVKWELSILYLQSCGDAVGHI